MKIAVFPGSFDPITNAHVDIIKRAMPLFDKIYVAIGVNSVKKTMLTLTARQEILREVFAAETGKIDIVHYEGLTVDFCHQVNAAYILRGMRNVSDFEFENAIAQNNRTLASDIETIFMVSSPGLAHISSTIVRDVLRNNGNVSPFIPADVLNYLLENPYD